MPKSNQITKPTGRAKRVATKMRLATPPAVGRAKRVANAPAVRGHERRQRSPRPLPIVLATPVVPDDLDQFEARVFQCYAIAEAVPA